jgi:hypothetical protein
MNERERRKKKIRERGEHDSNDGAFFSFFSFSGLDAHISKRVELSFRPGFSRGGCRDMVDFLGSRQRVGRRAIIGELEAIESINHVTSRMLMDKRTGVLVRRMMMMMMMGRRGGLTEVSRTVAVSGGVGVIILGLMAVSGR